VKIDDKNATAWKGRRQCILVEYKWWSMIMAQS
jgi:hypothetical protein